MYHVIGYQRNIIDDNQHFWMRIGWITIEIFIPLKKWLCTLYSIKRSEHGCQDSKNVENKVPYVRKEFHLKKIHSGEFAGVVP